MDIVQKERGRDGKPNEFLRTTARQIMYALASCLLGRDSAYSGGEMKTNSNPTWREAPAPSPETKPALRAPRVGHKSPSGRP
ncbi:hypothetical protein J6590_099126 [Homalodisca vitripennis]|nr:hypothetical protein J6590_023596 [Homalodisca vitripennis]KAG8333998.1 hypothetical protein J6590_099126 [Homalodisca vitripennis]